MFSHALITWPFLHTHTTHTFLRTTPTSHTLSLSGCAPIWQVYLCIWPSTALKVADTLSAEEKHFTCQVYRLLLLGTFMIFLAVNRNLNSEFLFCSLHTDKDMWLLLWTVLFLPLGERTSEDDPTKRSSQSPGVQTEVFSVPWHFLIRPSYRSNK